MIDSVVAEIQIEAVRQNLAAIRRCVGSDRPICVAVKANAYGHGLEQILPILTSDGIEQVSVANLAEALRVRKLGWGREILCFGLLSAIADERVRREAVQEAIADDVVFTVASTDDVLFLGAEAHRLNRPARAEIKIDSGMGRMGLTPEDADSILTEALRHPGVKLEGVYTHFATADEPDLSFARQQLACFVQWVEQCRVRGLAIGTTHAANSAAIFRLPASHLDKVRPGLAVYGYCDAPAGGRPQDLVPSMKVTSRVVAVRRLPKDHGVGYGRTFVTTQESVLGVVPIGYADGYNRRLSNNAVMTLEATRSRPRRIVPVAGRVSMDQTSVDLTDAGDVRVGDPVTVIDDDPAAPNSVENLARTLGTISYEITTLLGERVRRMARSRTGEATASRPPHLNVPYPISSPSGHKRTHRSPTS